MSRIGVAFVFICALAAGPFAALVVNAQTPVSGLAWTPCLASAATPGTLESGAPALPPELECASLAVPLDYGDPAGEQIAIGLNRLPALDPAKRIGSLVFNPGGPGGAATEFIAAAAMGAPLFTPAVREHFDLIGMDPRGVGSSTPVRCDPKLWNAPVSLFPDDEAAFREPAEHTQAVGESCLELTGPLLGHLDTESAARDIEAVRVALGEGKLNYYGLSYGTQLGANYAELYPENIRVMALDGALDHATSGLSMLVDESRAFEGEFERFAAWCAETADCALHGQDVGAMYDRLVRQADAEPIPAPDCPESPRCRTTVTGEDIRLKTQELLLFKQSLPEVGLLGWAGLATAIDDALKGDASSFAASLAEGETDWAFAGLAIECVDWPTEIDSYDDAAAAELLGRVTSPHTGGASQTWTILMGCMGWPVPVANPPGPLDVQGAPPILIVNATHDPSTAYIWAHQMREQIAGSVLLTRNGDGHTSFALPAPSRTADAIDTYLITGETPPPNTVYDT